MTPKEIIDDFREQAHDLADPPLWSDRTLLRHLNEARMQAARRARLLEDYDTAEVCNIKVKMWTSTATNDTYVIDPRVIYVRRVKHSLIDIPLPKLDLRDADMAMPGWANQDASQPVAWIPWGDHKLKLTPPPDADATLSLVVVREPLADVTIDGDEESMEFEPRYHYALKDWMMFRAYMERDTLEKYRPEEARDRLAMFEGEFGAATAAVQEKWMHRRHGFDEFEGLE